MDLGKSDRALHLTADLRRRPWAGGLPPRPAPPAWRRSKPTCERARQDLPRLQHRYAINLTHRERRQAAPPPPLPSITQSYRVGGPDFPTHFFCTATRPERCSRARCLPCTPALCPPPAAPGSPRLPGSPRVAAACGAQPGCSGGARWRCVWRQRQVGCCPCLPLRRLLLRQSHPADTCMCPFSRWLQASRLLLVHGQRLMPPLRRRLTAA